MKIVAVTACPTGIAHTYMAAEQLEKTLEETGGSRTPRGFRLVHAIQQQPAQAPCLTK